MGPEVLAIAAAATTAAGTIYSASAQADAMQQQAKADQERAVFNQQLAGAKAQEERAAAQRQSGEEMRSARLAQSRLGAVAGASGSGASDPTVMSLYEGIEGEGKRNADAVTAAGEQKAQGLTYQAALDRWTADTNAGIKRSAAKATALGGYLSAAGSFGSGVSSMALKYGGGRTQAGGSTGYGR